MTTPKQQHEILQAEATKEKSSEQLQLYAETNREQFTKKRSLETVHGRLGFRTGTPKAKPLKGFTWEACTNLLREFLPDALRVKEEPNKELIIERAQSDPLILPTLSKCGICVIQDETFFIELKKEVNAKPAQS